MTAATIRHPGEFRWETRLLGVTTLALTVIGIVSAYSSASYVLRWHNEAVAQAGAALVGALLFFGAAHMDYRIWRKFALPLFLVTVASLVIVAIVALIWAGRPVKGPLAPFFPLLNGSHRWIKAGVQIQPSEIMRFTLAAWFAAYAATLGPKVRSLRDGFVPMIAMLGGVVLLIRVEPSVSMAIVVGLIGVTVMFTAGAKLHHLLAVVILAGAGVVFILHHDAVRAARQHTFEGKTVDCFADDQPCASLIGFGHGGIFGAGFERGTQKFGHLPEADSDFLFSVIGEEWGFIGSMLVILGFVIFGWMGFRIARTASDPFGTYLAAGLTAGIGLSAFMHAAVVTWLMPTTGLTLPFMSIGRISLLLNLASAGVIVSIGRQRGRPARSR